jgi:(1->4)-alpha-D-glucan 1-alpha-D-glucosylmutase
MPLAGTGRVPRATYRLQLHRAFTFDDAAALAPYLAGLGVDTVYLSPILLSAPGSLHGYDVNDYRRLDADLGGREGFDRLSARLRESGLGVLLDFVPNHMGIDGPFNRWWRDVLESGRASPHARFFDIFWNSQRDGRIHLPLLEDHYGRVLEAGKLRAVYVDAELVVAYGQTTFPPNLATYVAVLAPIAHDAPLETGTRDQLAAWLRAASALAGRPTRRRRRHTAARARRLTALETSLAALVDAHADLRNALDARLTALNGTPGRPETFDELDALLDQQHYRLARWQTGAHESTYRRFFTIDSLVGLRMEHREVFRDSHALVAELLARGDVDGLRIDHIDGLWDPEQYLDRLQTLARRVAPTRSPLYVIVEKILTGDERLPAGWRTHGTTGYDFIRDLAGLFVDPGAEETFTRLFADLTGRRASFQAESLAAKQALLDDALSNTATILAARLADLIQQDRRWRDLSEHELRVAVREIVAHLHVYRTYRRLDGAVAPPDRAAIDSAAARAVRRHPLADVEAIGFVRDALTGDYPPAEAARDYHEAVARWALTLQQHTGAVMAKAVEDTAFYTYTRFIALNEVGGDPDRFGDDVDRFHVRAAARGAATPHALIATMTHDTKLGEDTRARLYALSDIPAEWDAWVREWTSMNRRHKTIVGGVDAPDPAEELRLYQAIVGIWPLGDDERVGDLADRLSAYAAKAANEAHIHSSWQQPNAEWIAAVEHFIGAILADDAPGGFLASVRPRARRVAELGMVVALAQVAIKLTAPGVPDIYQGQEIWDFSLVDPDNRRPVDYARRRALAERLDARSWPDLLRAWEDGAIKLRLTRDLLRLRARRPSVFHRGEYRPLAARGTHATRVVAFARGGRRRGVVTIVPRLAATVGSPPLGVAWGDTTIDLGGGAPFTHVLTGARVPATNARLAEIFADAPIGVLER